MAKILIFSHEFPPTQGGAGSVADSMATCLSSNHEVTVFTRMVNHKLELKFKFVSVKIFPIIFPLIYWLKLKKQLKLLNPDKIILNDLGAALTAAFFFSDLQKEKSYMLFHGNEYEAILNKSTLKKKIFSYYYEKLIQRSCKLLFVSSFLMDKILLSIKDKSLSDKSVVIYNGIDTGLFAPGKKAILSQTTEILTVCRVVQQKGLDNIIFILENLKSRKFNFVWKLIGSGEYLDVVKKKICMLGLENYFIHIPHVPRAELKFHYSMASVFLLLSEFEESFGLVYLEANACGTPVIGKDKGGVVEAIVNSESGFLVKDNREVVNIIYEERFRTIKHDDCIRHANKFNIIEYNIALTKILFG